MTDYVIMTTFTLVLTIYILMLILVLLKTCTSDLIWILYMPHSSTTEETSSKTNILLKEDVGVGFTGTKSKFFGY